VIFITSVGTFTQTAKAQLFTSCVNSTVSSKPACCATLLIYTIHIIPSVVTIVVSRHEGNQFSCETIAVVAIVMYSSAAAANYYCVCDCVC